MTENVKERIKVEEVINKFDGKGTAVFIKKLKKDNWDGDARLYRLSPPLETHEYVAVSATSVAYSGLETYIFGCDKDGESVKFTELIGSFKGALDHKRALEGAGYIVILPENE